MASSRFDLSNRDRWTDPLVNILHCLNGLSVLKDDFSFFSRKRDGPTNELTRRRTNGQTNQRIRPVIEGYMKVIMIAFFECLIMIIYNKNKVKVAYESLTI